MVGGEDGRGGEGGRQAPAGQVTFFQPSIHQVDDHSDHRYKVDVGGPRPGEILQLRKPKMKLEFSAHHKILTSFAESYNEDFSLANKLPEGNRRDWLVQ